jgi:hypothetical protein
MPSLFPKIIILTWIIISRWKSLAYRIVPFASSGDIFGRGGINSEVMYDNMVNKFKWGGVENPNVYLDENVLRMLANFRSTFARLAIQLINENKPDSARKALDKCMEVIPDRVVPFNVYNILLIEAYYKLEIWKLPIKWQQP